MPLDQTALLEEAELQYHKLVTGRQAVEFRDQNGELIRYTPATAVQLAKYIATLKSNLGIGCSGPLRVFF